RRVRHVLTENDRVLRAVRLLRAAPADLPRHFGELMNRSHASMMADYEITVGEIDHLVATALRAGAVGARMTGGGFGGSVIALMPTESVDEICDTVAESAL